MRRRFIVLFFFAAIVAGCGGAGGGAVPSSPSSSPTPCPAHYAGAPPDCVAATSSESFALQPAPTSTPLPATGGVSGTIDLPSGSGTLQITTSLQNPTSVGPLPANVSLLYITLTAIGGPVTLDGLPGFIVTLGAVPTGPVHLAQLNSGSWITIEGPASVNGATIYLSGTSQPTIKLPQQQSINLLLFQGAPIASSSPSPTPTPNATPTPTSTPAAGSYVEFPLTIGGANHITAGPDGALWFTGGTPTQAYVERATTSAQVTTFPVPLNTSEPQSAPPPIYGMTVGPDKNLWFSATLISGPTTTSLNGMVTEVTTGGQMTEYTIPGNSVEGLSIPYSIASGPDGAVWFTDQGQKAVDRLTLTGGLTKYTIPDLQINQPSMYDVPSGITSGPDGALWVTIDGPAQNVARVTTTGSFTEFPVPVTDGSPNSIVAASDGALWFGTSSGIGRITTAGQIEFFSVPPYNNAQTGAAALIIGPDNAIWFTGCYFGSSSPDAFIIGRMTLQGSVTEYPVSSCMTSLAVGPDKNIWFTDGPNGVIGYMVP